MKPQFQGEFVLTIILKNITEVGVKSSKEDEGRAQQSAVQSVLFHV